MATEKICTICNNKNIDSATVCSYCGSSLEENPTNLVAVTEYIGGQSNVPVEDIEAWKEGRISDLQYLETVEGAMNSVRSREDGATPPELRHTKHAAAYFGLIRETAGNYFTDADRERLLGIASEMAISIEQIIEKHKIRDWVRNTDVQNQMKVEIEDYIFDEVHGKHNIQIDMLMLDEILDNLIELARRRDALQ